MPAYETNNLLATSPAQQNLSSAYKTQIALFASNAVALRRGAIFEIGCSVDQAPVNNTLLWDLSYITATGTGTDSAGHAPHDTADPAALCRSKINHTAEPTVTANSSRWARAINQQVTFVWNAAGMASMIRFAAVNNEGYALRAKAAVYTSTVLANIRYEE